MIESITLTNWRSHEKSELHFHPGTNLIMGNMGTGKSSVLDAISFALFGTFPALERRKLKLENVLRHGSARASIVLGLRWNGIRYSIERTLEQDKRGVSSQATLHKEESMLDSGPVAVTRYIENLLGVQYDLFTRAIYSEQNNIDYFLNLDPRRRKQEMDALLGLDKFETVRAGAVSVLHRLKAERKLLEDRFEPLQLEEALKRLEEMRLQKERLDQLISQQEQKLKGLELQSQNEEKEYAFLRKRYEEWETLRQNLLRLESRLEQARRQVQPLEEKKAEQVLQQKQQLEAERPGLIRQKKELEEKIQKLQTQRAKAELEKATTGQHRLTIAGQRQKLEQLGQGRSALQLQQELEEAERVWSQTQAQEKALAQEMTQLKEWQGRLQAGMEKCPLCEQPLDRGGIGHVQKEREQRLERNALELERLRASLAQGRPGISGLRQRLSSMQVTQKMLEEAERALAAIPPEAERAVPLQALEALSAEKQAFDDMVLEKSRIYERVLAQLKDIERQRLLQEEAARLSKEVETGKGKLRGMVMDKETVEKARGRLEEARLMQERERAEFRNLQLQQKNVQEIQKGLEAEKMRLEGLRNEIGQRLQLEDQVARYRQAILETQVLLRNDLVEAINGALGGIWRIFYPYGNYPELRLKADEKDYVMEVHERGWKPLESIASGGERSCAALTLRVALATVLTPTLSWLILDEPTHNLDKNTVELLSQTLQFKVPEVVKQTFVITHEEALMGSDFAASYRLEREKNGMGSSKIERV